MLCMRLKSFCCYTLACLVWLTMHSAELRAQNPASSPTPDAWYFQYDLFQALLEQQGLQPTSSLDDALNHSKDSTIVIAGDPAQLSSRRLAEFVQNGGAVLLATDRNWSVPSVAEFIEGPVTSNDPQTRYQGFKDCVKVPASGAPELSGVSTIVTNISGRLQLARNSPFRWTVAAAFPDTCLPVASRGMPLLAIGHSQRHKAGVIVVSADASLFTNGMLWHGDNAILTIRVSRLLSGSGRRRLAFLTDGQVQPSSRDRIASQAGAGQESPPVAVPLPEPNLQKLLKLGNAIANEVGRSNILNETLKERPRHRTPSQYFRLLLIAATVVAFLAAAWILITSGPLRPFFAGGRKAFRRARADQQSDAAAGPRDYRTPAGYLAREFCWELTGSRHSADWQKYLAQQLVFEPTLGPSDQQDLAKIVDIASRGCRQRVSPADFERLGKTIAALRARHEAAVAAASSA